MAMPEDESGYPFWLEDTVKTLRRISLVLGALALATNTACYAYAPVSGENLKPAETVRVMLSAEGTAAMGGTLVPDVTQVDGKISGVGADGALVLSPDWLRTPGGTSRAWSGKGPVTLPARYVTSVELKKLDKRKTVRGSVVAVAFAVAVMLVQQKWVNDGRKGAGGSGSFDPPTGDH